MIEEKITFLVSRASFRYILTSTIKQVSCPGFLLENCRKQRELESKVENRLTDEGCDSSAAYLQTICSHIATRPSGGRLTRSNCTKLSRTHKLSRIKFEYLHDWRINQFNSHSHFCLIFVCPLHVWKWLFGRLEYCNGVDWDRMYEARPGYCSNTWDEQNLVGIRVIDRIRLEWHVNFGQNSWHADRIGPWTEKNLSKSQQPWRTTHEQH